MSAVSGYELSTRLQEIVQLVGLAGALALVEKYGGTRVYVPVAPVVEHPLTRLLGPVGVAALAAAWGRDWLDVPRGVGILRAERDRAVRAAFDAGTSARKLALEYRLTERHIWRILAGVDAEPYDSPSRQLPLFDRY